MLQDTAVLVYLAGWGRYAEATVVTLVLIGFLLLPLVQALKS